MVYNWQFDCASAAPGWKEKCSLLITPCSKDCLSQATMCRSILETERDAALFALDAHERQADITQVDLADLRQVHYRALHRIITLEAAAHDAAPGGAHQHRIKLLEADLAAARASQAAAEGAAAERAGVLAAAEAALVALQGQRADEAAALQCLLARAPSAPTRPSGSCRLPGRTSRTCPGCEAPALACLM